ncbi:RagB/SusD family nutrient uptake outer membrane protein [Chitinophaga costaii]|nr:RagB/SusD family nutrient uptake outer membrane protein [Chitinophaga costaii]
MKKLFIYLTICATAGLSACNKDTLQQVDPNSPTPSSLNTESGIKDFALGVFQKWIADVPGASGSNIMFLGTNNHSILGDEVFSPYGNYGMRYTGQTYSITLPDGTKVINPIGNTQQEQLKSTNTRLSGSTNSFLYEWMACYFTNAQANLLLTSLDNTELKLSGDAATKKAVLSAWAYWWKGFSYSRIGSMYIAGVITNEPGNGLTNGNFVDHDAIITEANANFDKAIDILNGLTENADYDALMTAIIPTFNDNTDITTPAMWIRMINTYKARNFLANHKVATMTAADWATVKTLASAGSLSSDVVFQFGMDPDATNDLSGNFFHPFAFMGEGAAFTFVSERLIQDFKTGDQRFTKNFELLPAAQVNVRSRGLQFGTRWNAIAIEDGGRYATNNSVGIMPLSVSYEEAALMVAEADIHTDAIEAGLALIDEVRDFQGAGLAHVAGTGLNLAQATEELRRERRIGLFQRGVAFYDARRWGVTAPAAQGGGRAGAIVMVPGQYIGSNAAQALPCFMDYNYMDYWDVPQNELDFNAAATGSAPIKN